MRLNQIDNGLRDLPLSLNTVLIGALMTLVISSVSELTRSLLSIYVRLMASLPSTPWSSSALDMIGFSFTIRGINLVLAQSAYLGSKAVGLARMGRP